MLRCWPPRISVCYCRNGLAAAQPRRLMASDGRDRHRPPRDKAVYVAGQNERQYYYVLDTRGQLHLEESPHRNFTSCFKDKAFVTFFYQRLRRNTEEKYGDEYAKMCPYVSMCGVERNYLTPEDPLAPVVFVDYDAATNRLLYPADVAAEQVDPAKLLLSAATGRLYYPITALPRLAGEVGLLHPALCQRFAARVIGHERSGVSIEWHDGAIYPIGTL